MEKITLTEEILKVLRDTNGSIKLLDLSKLLNIRSDSGDYQQLKSLLKELSKLKIVRKLPKRKYILPDYYDSAENTGVLKIKDDRAYVEFTNENYKKVFIHKKHLHTAFEGDTVQVKILGIKQGFKVSGEVINILKRTQHYINGIIEFDNNIFFLLPENEKYYVDFIIPKNKLNGAKHNDRVRALFLAWDDRMKIPLAEVTEILQDKPAKIADFDSIVYEFNLPGNFNSEVITEAEKMAKPVSAELIKTRLDLRKELIITIDPVDAKDFDDALSLSILENGNFKLGVHIADVSHYVREKTVLDSEASSRGNSIYLVDRVIPMLPEKLSNEICSLQPNKIRLAYSVFMEFTKSGVLRNYEIHESVIKSKKRFNYDEVDKILVSGEGLHSKLILSLNQLAQTLRQKRFSQGGIDFDTYEIKFQLDNGIPENAIMKRSTPATMLVEECMLAANQVVASHIKFLSNNPPYSHIQKSKKLLPFIYRVHEEPEPKKLKEVFAFFKLLRPSVPIHGTSSKDINNFLERFNDLPEKTVVHQMLLRSMSKAIYSENNIGHYGLGYSDYTHFTSPIRRYPDLIVHRLLKEYTKDKIKNDRIKFLEYETKSISVHCSDRERIAVEAERASVKLAQTIFAANYLGIVFNGTISGVVNFGIFVLLDDIYVEGLIHVRDLYGDFYEFDEQHYRLIGKKKKNTFSIGKRIKVKIVNVNIDDKKIDLAYISDKVK
ncbi:MAG: ribonuclease R [Bacteroidetes bacterium]|nr:MAG: ribonuclease R [Bacteroidota bacterium]